MLCEHVPILLYGGALEGLIPNEESFAGGEIILAYTRGLWKVRGDWDRVLCRDRGGTKRSSKMEHVAASPQFLKAPLPCVFSSD